MVLTQCLTKLHRRYQLVLQSHGASLRLEDSLPTYSCDCGKEASFPPHADPSQGTLMTQQLASPRVSERGLKMEAIVVFMNPFII